MKQTLRAFFMRSPASIFFSLKNLVDDGLRTILLTILALILAASSQSVGAPILVGSDAAFDKLVRIDTATGATTVIGGLGDDLVAGLTYDWNHGILYGSSTRTDQLLTIDPDTGQTTVAGPFGVNLMHSIEYNPINNVLYGITNQSSTRALYEINLQTGAPTLLGYHNRSGLSGLAFDPIFRVMYASDAFSNQLYTINLQDGSTTLVGPFGSGTQIGVGLTYHTDVGLFASDNLASGARDDRLYQINPQTGYATLIGNTNTGNLLGLAFIPEPATVCLLGLGGLALLRRRRK